MGCTYEIKLTDATISIDSNEGGKKKRKSKNQKPLGDLASNAPRSLDDRYDLGQLSDNQVFRE